MILIIPIGGIGNRFKIEGFTKPKALIEVLSKPIIFYLLDNLNLNKIEYICIPYNKEYLTYDFENLLKEKYPNIVFKFLCLKNNTNGAAETINIAINSLNEKNNKPVLCLDSDSFYNCDIINQWNGSNCVFTILNNDPNPIYSYITQNKNDYIIDIKEKIKISDYACTGAYGFESLFDLKKYTYKIIKNNITQKSEFYTSGVIKEMLNDNLSFKNELIHNNSFICLGTPKQVQDYLNVKK